MNTFFTVTDEEGNTRGDIIEADDIVIATRFAAKRLRDAGMFVKHSSVAWKEDSDLEDPRPQGEVCFYLTSDASRAERNSDEHSNIFLIEKRVDWAPKGTL